MASRKPKAKPRVKPGQNGAAADQRRKLFIEAYLSNGENVTQAALAAGFSPKTAASQGSRLLKGVKVSQEIDSRKAEVIARVGLTTERTLREVARLAYANPKNFYNADGTLKAIHELDDDTAATIASVEVDEIKVEGVVVGFTKKIKHWDKNAALEKAMKFHGLYEKDNKQAADKVKVIFMTGGKDPELE